MIKCPECGETEDLAGRETKKGIRITCGKCSAKWLRDEQTHTCATCSGSDCVTRPRALTQYSRGTQLSIVAMGEIVLCRQCDAKMVEWSEGSARAVPMNYRSAALDPEAVADRDEDDDGSVLITP